jgi:hypothetical protein
MASYTNTEVAQIFFRMYHNTNEKSQFKLMTQSGRGGEE